MYDVQEKQASKAVEAKKPLRYNSCVVYVQGTGEINQ